MVALGSLERAVVECLWQSDGPATAREVHECLARSREIAYTTVNTTLQRIARKGLVHESRAERAFRYSVAATREEVFDELLSDALGVAGDADAALVRFVGNLDESGRTALRAALDRADEPR
jgi:predicted transcriptional regulator